MFSMYLACHNPASNGLGKQVKHEIGKNSLTQDAVTVRFWKWPNVCEQTLRLRQSIVFLSYSSISCVLGNTSYIIIPEYTKLENHCNLFMLINIPLVCLVSLQGGAPSYKLVPSHYRYLIWFVHHSRTCTADKATSPTAWSTQLRSGDPIISLWNIMMCRWSWMTMDDYVQFHHLNL